MNLLELANYVCGKSRQTDAASVLKAKDYVRQRYETVYNEQLWKDSIAQVSFTYTPATSYLNAAGIYLLPRIVDRLLAARTTERELRPEKWEIYYRTDPDVFAQTGLPVAYFTMSPIIWSALQVGSTGLARLQIYAASASDNGTSVQVTWIDRNQEAQSQTVTVSDTAQDITGDAAYPIDVMDLEMVSKPPTSSGICVKVFGAADCFVTLAAADTFYKTYPRLRLMSAPAIDTAIKVLCKRKLIPLSHDYDQPIIRNVDNLLIALAMGDMQQRARQYGKANSLYGEASALLNQLKGVETIQEHNNPRIVPDEVDSDPYGFASGAMGKGTW